MIVIGKLKKIKTPLHKKDLKTIKDNVAGN